MAVFSQLSDQDKAELWASLALKHTRGLGLHSANALVEHYGNAFEAVELGRRAPGCWVSEGFVNERVAKTFANETWRGKARQEWEALQRSGVCFLFRTHPRYPQLLAEIHDAPLVLYYDGDIRLLANPMVGVVGSRKCSEAGLLACAVLTRQLSSFGVTIVSGLAKGIDRAAHIAGLSGLGSSVAVLGTGIDVIYPESNEDVFGVLQEKGLILSEFLPGTAPHARNFPIRNRIISGLSRGVLIVEAARRSGSLITARLALEQGRDVFAIPGSSVGKHSEGCHELIRNGAKPVFSAEDIVLDLAPLLAVDVKEQLELLKTEEIPGSVSQLTRLLSEETPLPPLLAPVPRPQETGYSYRAGGKSSALAYTSVQDTPPHEKAQGQQTMSPRGPDMPAGLSDHRHTALPSAGSSCLPEKQQGLLGPWAKLADEPENASQGTLKRASGETPELEPETLQRQAFLIQAGEGPASGPSFEASAVATIEPGQSSDIFGAGDSTDGPFPALGEFEQRLVALLRDDWRHIDWLSQKLDADTALVSTALTLLEVDGVVIQRPGMFYRLAE